MRRLSLTPDNLSLWIIQSPRDETTGQFGDRLNI